MPSDEREDRRRPALHGLRAVEVGGGTAGPIAAMLLADAGVDVIKLEQPVGDRARAAPGFAMWNRGKRGIVADLTTPAGRRRLAPLLAGADVLVAAAPLDELAAWGLEPAAVCASHPRLVCLHTPPYLTGAPWAGGAESHALLAAAGGVAMRQASWDGGPIELVYPHPLYAQGAWAAACAVAALLERERSAAGQAVTVAGVHGVAVTSSASLVLEAGRPPRVTAVGPGGAHPSYSRYACADGRWLFLGALTPRFQDRALAVLGLSDMLDDPRIGGVHERLLLPENRAWARTRVADVFLTRPRAEWLRALAAAGCPAGPLADRDGWLDHPQVRAIGMRVEVDDPDRGRVVMPGNPLVLTRSPNLVSGPAPGLGQHDGGPLGWRPLPAAGRDAAPAPGPLTGLRVLDLGAILAGPFAGCLLADLGADVVKVEPPGGDSFRDLGFTYNRGMRSLAIDLSRPRGRDAFIELVRRADVVIDNYRPGVLGRLGIDHAALERVRPGIVTLSITGYGEGGPLSEEPGFDPILQGLSGMMTAQGGGDEPVFHTIAVNDVAAAALAVLGACLALVHRGRAGEGQRVWTSLAGIAAFMQSGELVRFAGRSPAPGGGRDHRGRGPLDRFYPVADGWVRVEASARHVPALAGAGLLGDGEAPATDAAADAALAASLATLPRVDAVALLSRAGVPAAAARRFEELLDDRAALDAELLHWHERPGGPSYTTAGRFAWFSRTQLRARLVAPGLGEHSSELLLEAGVPEAVVAEL
ncbi:MAG TPA: CoA transferase, partial [Candidatus Eisenbacteria bacterium]|nr:CoA transferase [Candidatus Eisenbacteria bacterium]